MHATSISACLSDDGHSCMTLTMRSYSTCLFQGLRIYMKASRTSCIIRYTSVCFWHGVTTALLSDECHICISGSKHSERAQLNIDIHVRSMSNRDRSTCLCYLGCLYHGEISTAWPRGSYIGICIYK